VAQYWKILDNPPVFAKDVLGRKNYCIYSRNLRNVFPSLAVEKIRVRKICGFFFCGGLDLGYSSIIENTVSFVNILL
jgi:hypothetical protein